jgi:hypothetical protein
MYLITNKKNTKKNPHIYTIPLTFYNYLFITIIIIKKKKTHIHYLYIKKERIIRGGVYAG